MHIKHTILTYEVCGHFFPRTETFSSVPRVPSLYVYCGFLLVCCWDRTFIFGFSLIFGS